MKRVTLGVSTFADGMVRSHTSCGRTRRAVYRKSNRAIADTGIRFTVTDDDFPTIYLPEGTDVRFREEWGSVESDGCLIRGVGSLMGASGP